jgi:hypothetical protein
LPHLSINRAGVGLAASPAGSARGRRSDFRFGESLNATRAISPSILGRLPLDERHDEGLAGVHGVRDRAWSYPA